MDPTLVSASGPVAMEDSSHNNLVAGLWRSAVGFGDPWTALGDQHTAVGDHGPNTRRHQSVITFVLFYEVTVVVPTPIPPQLTSSNALMCAARSKMYILTLMTVTSVIYSTPTTVSLLCTVYYRACKAIESTGKNTSCQHLLCHIILTVVLGDVEPDAT